MAETRMGRNKNLNIPNALSVLRLILIIPFVWCFLHGDIFNAAIALVLSGLSDLFDGWIARKFDQQTELGKMLDPLADKLTQGAVAICLAIEQPVLIPLLTIFVLKELLMLVAAVFLVFQKKKRPGGSKWYGKVSTVLFYFSFGIIVALRAFWGIENLTLTVVLLSITAVFMVYAFVEYYKIFRKILLSEDPNDKVDLKADIKERKIKK